MDSTRTMADEHLVSLQPGTVIAGRYEVVKCLGAGSMGLVYACRHRELPGHIVAMKVLFPEVAQDRISAARFRNEIFASYKVSHPHVVRAFEYIRDGDLAAYTMEYVGGGDLAERLSRPGYKMPIEEVVKILSQMCSGVQAIHDAGIVHRDLKPENILLTKEGNVKIADFGIARTGHGPKLTEHGGVVGTIDYVSPEYMLNSQVDWRSDIYAIGILGYEMLTGESPFRGDSVYATMTKRLKTDPQPPSKMRPDCTPAIDKIVLRAMERDPEQRYQSTAEMFYDLQALSPGNTFMTGTLLQLSKTQSEGYRGPTHNSPTEETVADLFEDKGSPVSVQQPLRDTAELTPHSRAWNKGIENSEASRQSTIGGAGVSAQRAGHGNFSSGDSEETLNISVDGTYVLSPDIAKIASQYSDETATLQEPVRMERVLNYTDMVSSSYSSATVPTEVRVTGGGIDDSRIKRLTQLVEGDSKAVWIEIATVVIAGLIGVGLGVLCLRVFFPEIWGGGSSPVKEQRLEDLEK